MRFGFFIKIIYAIQFGTILKEHFNKMSFSSCPTPKKSPASCPPANYPGLVPAVIPTTIQTDSLLKYIEDIWVKYNNNEC